MKRTLKFTTCLFITIILMSGIHVAPIAAEGKAEKTEIRQAIKGKVNINTASIKDLASLEGIGKKKAAAIIAYRTKKGKFTSIEELSKVDGIGKKTLSKIREGIVLQ